MAQRIQSRLAIVAAALVSAVAAGCGGGDGLDRQRISGTVKLNGQPLEWGTIQFQPESSATGEMVAGGAVIQRDGSFEIPQAQGLTPGTYQVRVSSSDIDPANSSTSAMPGDENNKPAKERVANKYNVNTELKAEVAAGKPNVFSFDVTSGFTSGAKRGRAGR